MVKRSWVFFHLRQTLSSRNAHSNISTWPMAFESFLSSSCDIRIISLSEKIRQMATCESKNLILKDSTMEWLFQWKSIWNMNLIVLQANRYLIKFPTIKTQSQQL